MLNDNEYGDLLTNLMMMFSRYNVILDYHSSFAHQHANVCFSVLNTKYTEKSFGYIVKQNTKKTGQKEHPPTS